MKVLFLDVDGVLNSAAWFNRESASGLGMLELDPEPLRLLIYEILPKTGAKVVLSSTWRLSETFTNILKQNKIPIYDCTPKLNTVRRSFEINAWLTAHADEVTTYAIVDDDGDAGDGHLGEHFVRTDWERGLQPEHAERLIQLLNG